MEVRIMGKDYAERMAQYQENNMAEPRRTYLKKEDFEVHGYTVDCPGCVSILRATARQAHTEACRKRLEDTLRGTVRSDAANRRTNEYIARALKRSEDQRIEAEHKAAEGKDSANTDGENKKRKHEDAGLDRQDGG